MLRLSMAIQLMRPGIFDGKLSYFHSCLSLNFSQSAEVRSIFCVWCAGRERKRRRERERCLWGRNSCYKSTWGHSHGHLKPENSACILFSLSIGLAVNPIQGRGGGHIVPPPPGKLSKISQERLELQSWNFLTFQMNKFSKNAFGFQLSPPTLGYHRNAQHWRMFSNNIFQQFSWKISPELERFLVYLWRVS